MDRKEYSQKTLLAGLFIILIILMIVSMMIGRYSISVGDLFEMIVGNNSQQTGTIVLLKVRLPRILAAVFIGGMLSLSGASYQGMLRNPMISPDFLGASAGAGFGAAFSILLGANAIVTQISAFLFGIMAVFFSYGISRAIEGTSLNGIVVLVLTGMVISALFSAFISIIKFVADPYDQLPAITFWLMGGLSYITLSDVKFIILPMALGTIPMMLLSWRLNILSLGDTEASSLGISVRKMRLLYIVCATLLTSASVAIGGMIGWVGLIIPHAARMLTGVNQRKLLPVSMLMGSIFLLIVDDLARSLFAQEIPLGILTAIVGAPFFLYLLFRGKSSFSM